jgi:hypothetical protein
MLGILNVIMKFEEFEKVIREKGYGIAAMNHYNMGGKPYTFCVIFGKNKERAFKAEAEKSEDVFESIVNQIIDFEKGKNIS